MERGLLIKKAKILTAVILTVCIISSNFLSVYANEKSNYINQVNYLALNSPQNFPTTSNWINNKIINLVPLYDVNDSLYAYCVDIVNEDTGNYAYMIILAITDKPQILEFHPNGSSPYMNIADKKAYYAGLSKYYIKETDSMLQDLTTGNKINKKDISVIISKENSHLSYNAIGGNSNIKGVNAIGGYSNIDAVPDYKSEKGCAPTSLAMLIKYTYGNLVDSQTTLIDRLAYEFDSLPGSGATPVAYIKPGVIRYLSSKGITPTFCRFISENYFGDPIYGMTYNSLETYQTYINAKIPVVVIMFGAKGTSPAFPSGFNDHAVCGTGYYVGSAGEFIIVHTTAQEGDVYVAYSEYALGQFAWFTVY